MGCCSSKDGADTSAKKATLPKMNLKPGSVVVHVGPLEVGADGVVIKPKFNFGVQGSHVSVTAGLRDVRDGISANASALLMKSYASAGGSVTELLRNVKAEEHVPVLDDIITAVPDVAAAVLDLIRVDILSNCASVEGVVYVYTGVGVSAGIYLGWLDTNGYRMLGLEGKMAAAAALGMTVKAGLHESKKAVRVVVWIANVGVDMVVHLERPCEQGADDAPAAAADQ